jgi:hypothetical protein
MIPRPRAPMARLGSGAQGRPRNLDDPDNGDEAMKGAFGKRGQRSRADALRQAVLTRQQRTLGVAQRAEERADRP